MESQGKQHEIEKYERVSSFFNLQSEIKRLYESTFASGKNTVMWKITTFSSVFARVNRKPVAKPELILHSCRQISSMETVFHFFGVAKFLIDYI